MLRSVSIFKQGAVRNSELQKNRITTLFSAASGLFAVLLPKCPMCLFGYSALLTVIGVKSVHLIWARSILAGVFFAWVVLISVCLYHRRRGLTVLGVVAAVSVLTFYEIDGIRVLLVSSILLCGYAALYFLSSKYSNRSCQICDSKQRE